jgi:hypothetical protein
MPNPVKYSTVTPSGSLRKGNMAIGVNPNVALGPTSVTGFYAGITPPSGGYTIYQNKASQGPSIYVANNDSNLIRFTKEISGTTYANVAQCLNYYASQTDKICVNFNYEGIVTNGLVLNLDAGFDPSYPTTGTTWYDLSGNTNNGTLTNGPVFNSANSGSIVFDGIDDYILQNAFIDAGSNFSVFAWIKPGGGINVRNGIIGNSYPYNSRQGFFLSTATNYAGTLNTFFISIGGDAAYRTANNSSITLNTWNYVGGVVINGGEDIKLYVNGIETSYSGGVLSSGTITYSTNQFYVGARVGGNLEPFVGNIATSQIYNRVLSSTEILQNYNAQKNRFGL